MPAEHFGLCWFMVQYNMKNVVRRGTSLFLNGPIRWHRDIRFSAHKYENVWCLYSTEKSCCDIIDGATSAPVSDDNSSGMRCAFKAKPIQFVVSNFLLSINSFCVQLVFAPWNIRLCLYALLCCLSICAALSCIEYNYSSPFEQCCQCNKKNHKFSAKSYKFQIHTT